MAVVDRRHDTSRTVGSLRARSAAHPGVYRALFASIGALVREARAAIETGDLARLGEAMTCDHGLLRTCGVSTPTLDAAVDEALAAGALGAKLTGGGGGGAIVALAPLAAADLAERLRLPGRLPFVARWIPGLAAVLSAILLFEGWREGEWRAVAVTEVQVLAVAAAAWFGLR